MERKLQLNNNLQQRGNLLERKTTLETDIEKARLDVEEWKQNLQPMVAKQLAAQATHVDSQKKRNSLTEQARRKVKCRYKSHELQNIRNIYFAILFYRLRNC
jgi:hypothetical protein